jgi:RimJ/RimL family protein N-acetyltransferase
MEPRDAAGLTAFHHRLSARSVYLRFFSVHPELTPREVKRFTSVDHHDREALVAVADDVIVGVVRYDRMDSTTAEVAVVVEDAWQRRGVASALLSALAARATANGVGTFVAETLVENEAMRRVFGRMGWKTAESYEGGVVESRFGLGSTSS